MMKNIFFYGDSNTWGFIPATEFERYPYEKRICGVLQKELRSNYHVIEMALNGRMTAFDDPMNEHKNGSKQLGFLLDSQRPLDLVVIMLGVNDMKHYMNLNAIDSAMGVNKLIEITRASASGPQGACPEILLISPPQYVECDRPFGHIFDGAIEKTKGFRAAYEEVAQTQKVHFVDAAEVAVPPKSLDGVHIDDQGAAAIAHLVSEKVKRIFS